MRERRGWVDTLLLPACTALVLGSCAHLPGRASSARAEAGSAQPDMTDAGAHRETARRALAASKITTDAVLEHVDSLTGAGRIAYLKAELHALGLEPAGDSGAFVRRLPFNSVAARAGAAHDADSGAGSDGSAAPGSKQPAAPIEPVHSVAKAGSAGREADVSSTFLLRASGVQGDDAPVFGRDFFVHSISAASASGPLVWAGVAAPGRRAPGPEAAGRVLAFYLPGEAPDRAWHAALSNAVQGSLDAGAAAVLLVLDPALDEKTIDALASRPRHATASVMVAGLRYGAAHRIFRNGLRDLDQLRNGPNQLVPVTGTTVSLRAGGAGIADERASNVIAMLPGSDPVLKDTYVVFSVPIVADVTRGRASRPGGAASRRARIEEISPSTPAAAVWLEVAKAFAALPARPARSLIFLGAGRSAGRLGSQYFAVNPPVPAARIVANISVDNVFGNATDTIAAVGRHYTSMGPLVREIARTHPELGLAVAPDLSPEDDRFLSGHSFSFARIGVPAISFTAAPPRETSDDGDVVEADDTIDSDEAGRLARVARFIFYFGHALASRAERPIWTAEGRAAIQKNE